MSAGANNLGQALGGQPPAPCERCEWRARCAAGELACEAFARYVANGHQHGRGYLRDKPTHAKFVRIAKALEGGKA